MSWSRTEIAVFGDGITIAGEPVVLGEVIDAGALPVIAPQAAGDIRIVFDPLTSSGDFAMNGPGLWLGQELESAVLISLFTDQLASPDDLLPPGQADDPRGWWADTYEADQIGSRLWQVFWRQTTSDTVLWVNDTVRKALQWMLDDGVASAVDVEAQLLGRGRIGLAIVITEPSGQQTPFSYAWAQEG